MAASPCLALLLATALAAAASQQQNCSGKLGCPPGKLKFPTLFPPWEVVWQLNRSTIAQPCNYSGWFDPALAAQFGVVSFDWANNENAWHARPLNGSAGGSDSDDLVTQARMVKALNNETKVFVYRQGQGAGSPAGKQATAVLADPQYDGFFLKSVGGPGALPAGTRVGGTFDFRNASLVQWLIPGLQHKWGQSRFPPPEKSGLVLSIEMGCAVYCTFTHQRQTPRSDSANLEPP